MKPKILFISTPRAIGGGEIYLANILPLLKDKYDCSVLGTGPVLRLLRNDAGTHRIILFPKIIQKLIKRNYRLKKIYYRLYFKIFLARHSYDIINLQEFDGAFVESINAKPMVLTEQTRLLVGDNLKDWAKGCLGTIDKIICVSQQTLQDVTGLGVDKDRCVVIHNGVDTARFKPAQKPGVYIDWVGRVEEEDKNPLLFAQIAEAAQAQGLDYKFRLIGGGRALKKMRGYAQRHGIVNIDILGPKSPEQMIDIYQQTKLLCMTSKTEGLPYAALEAMACGKPVVSTDVGGMSEIINSSECGKLVDGFDEWRFLAEIKALMENDGLYEKVSQAARARIEKEFSISKQFLQTDKQYGDLLADKQK